MSSTKNPKNFKLALPLALVFYFYLFFPFRKRTSLIKLLLSLFCVFRNLRLLLRLFLSRNFFFFSPFFSGFSTFVLFLFFCTPFRTRAIFNTKQQNLPLFSSLFLVDLFWLKIWTNRTNGNVFVGFGHLNNKQNLLSKGFTTNTKV